MRRMKRIRPFPRWAHFREMRRMKRICPVTRMCISRKCTHDWALQLTHKIVRHPCNQRQTIHNGQTEDFSDPHPKYPFLKISFSMFYKTANLTISVLSSFPSDSESLPPAAAKKQCSQCPPHSYSYCSQFLIPLSVRIRTHGHIHCVCVIKQRAQMSL